MTDHQQDPKAATEEAGGYGTPTVEQEMAGGGTTTEPGFDADANADANADENSKAAVPSAEAEMDASNTEKPDPGRSFSSEPGQDAAGLPDGSGTDLPEGESPKDREGHKDTFDAG